jgi:hypothetical protein
MEKVYFSTTETAKLIRKELKHYFSAVKFSVRSNSYSGGSSISVNWVDGPTESAVDAIVKRFEGASFDGMTDSKSYLTDFVVLEGAELPVEVSYGGDYVFTNRTLSKEFKAELAKIAQTILDENRETRGQVFDGNTFYQNLATMLGFTFNRGYGENLIWKLAQEVNFDGAMACRL